MHDDENRDEHDNAPPRIEGQGEPQEEKRQRHIEWIAGEAKRAGCDNGRGGKRGIHVRTCSPQSISSPYRDRDGKYDQRAAGPKSTGMIKDWHRPDPTKRKNNGERDAVEQRREHDDASVILLCHCTISLTAQRSVQRRAAVRAFGFRRGSVGFRC